MPRTLLRDDQWDRIQHFLSGKASDRGVTAKDKGYEYLMVDGSITQVHQHGAPKKHLNMINQLANPEVV